MRLIDISTLFVYFRYEKAHVSIAGSNDVSSPERHLATLHCNRYLVSIGNPSHWQ